MRFVRSAAVGVAVAAFLGSTVAAGATAQSPKPAAADVGITDREISLAVVADVDTPIVPGLFKAAVDTMRAWAKYVNKHGGVAGRKVTIDFYDSKLNPNEARDAAIKACSDNFAMVGGEALFMTNVDDIVGCEDAQGSPIGIPDLPGLTLDPAELCSPVTFVFQSSGSYCETRDQSPQTWLVQTGDARFYLKQQKDLHGVFIVPADLQSAKNAQQAVFEGAVEVGIEKDGQGFYDVSAMAPQSALTPVVQGVKNNGSNFVYNGSSFGTMVLLRREAKVQGVDSVDVWACNQGCYDAEFLQQGGADVEGTYSVLATLPFYTEYKSNATLRAVVKELGGVEKLTANAVASLIAALLFQQAAEQAVADGGTLTRQSLLDALETTSDFDAGGMIGPTNIGAHEPPACIVMTQVKNGKWTRAYPKKSGTFDCNPKNLMELQLDFS